MISCILTRFITFLVFDLIVSILRFDPLSQDNCREKVRKKKLWVLELELFAIEYRVSQRRATSALTRKLSDRHIRFLVEDPQHHTDQRRGKQKHRELPGLDAVVQVTMHGLVRSRSSRID